MNTKNLLTSALLLLATLLGNAQEEPSPFVIRPAVVTNEGVPTVTFSFTFPAQHRLYADELSFDCGSECRFTLPTANTIPDKHSGGTKRVFDKPFTASAPVSAIGASRKILLNLRGCNEEECFFPETRQFFLQTDLTITQVVEPESSNPASAKSSLTDGFVVAARDTGFKKPSEFLSFLQTAEKGRATAHEGVFAGMGLAATIGLILLGGLALNLTPCVLPMIPINLAILGAGSANGSRSRGFTLGGAYGTGMAIAYGGLGLIVVLTGSKFGTLNSSPVFNFIIAIVFVLLGLAMFDIFHIDLSRFQNATRRDSSDGGAIAAALTMGAVSALLAGACVAPVVISVMLLATTFYQEGEWLGLALPFVLGLGMALPWPFAAAGLSFLPKPGRWMARVKHVFGVAIIGFAAWYGWLGWNLSRDTHVASRTETHDRSLENLRAALAESQRSGKPVLIDFWATWCKNCAAMEHSTFSDGDVQQRLRSFIFVKFQAEHLNDADIKPTLDEFGVLGLPTFVVLKPKTSPAAEVPQKHAFNR